MITQTLFVDNLKRRMYESFNNKYYLESIACSYAIIENRTKRICEHLGKSTIHMNLNDKTRYIYNTVKNKCSVNDVKKRRLIGFIQYRISKDKLMEIDLSMDYDTWIKSIDNDLNKNPLVIFRKQRNEFTHKMYEYDSNNPKLTNFDDYKDLAERGQYVAKKLCRIASRLKEKKKNL